MFQTKVGYINLNYYRFSYTGTWEIVNLFVGKKTFSYHVCYKTQAENITKYSEVTSQIDHGQTELSNMLAKKNELNEINKEETFTRGFKDCRKIKRKISQILDHFQNLLIKLTVKASSEKVQLLYEFLFSLNPGGKPNDAQA